MTSVSKSDDVKIKAGSSQGKKKAVKPRKGKIYANIPEPAVKPRKGKIYANIPEPAVKSRKGKIYANIPEPDDKIYGSEYIKTYDTECDTIVHTPANEVWINSHSPFRGDPTLTLYDENLNLKREYCWTSVFGT